MGLVAKSTASYLASQLNELPCRQAGWLAAWLRLATDEATWLAMRLGSQLGAAHKFYRVPPHIAHTFSSGTPEAKHRQNKTVGFAGRLRGICGRVCGEFAGAFAGEREVAKEKHGAPVKATRVMEWR